MVFGPTGVSLRSIFDSQGYYEIKILGILSDPSSGHFEGMVITSDGNETVLVGSVADQATLFKILNQIRYLRHTLLSVNRIGSDQDEKLEDD
ncbi:MAG: hypothetical protein KAU50_01720 [Candidatus Marinimicrobia bacterium]|nr:hypothetical protein [Candidatus Neomarinimicrobiota bacterium]